MACTLYRPGGPRRLPDHDELLQMAQPAVEIEGRRHVGQREADGRQFPGQELGPAPSPSTSAAWTPFTSGCGMLLSRRRSRSPSSGDWRRAAGAGRALRDWWTSRRPARPRPALDRATHVQAGLAVSLDGAASVVGGMALAVAGAVADPARGS